MTILQETIDVMLDASGEIMATKDVFEMQSTSVRFSNLVKRLNITEYKCNDIETLSNIWIHNNNAYISAQHFI